MMRRLTSHILIFSLLFAQASPALSEYGNLYRYYMEEADKALVRREYVNAYYYLEVAHQSNPNADEPIEMLSLIPPSIGPYEKSYRYYIDLAKKSFDRAKYRTAMFYFKTAQMVNPSKTEAIRFFNIAKRHLDGDVKDVTPDVERRNQIIPEYVHDQTYANTTFEEDLEKRRRLRQYKLAEERSKRETARRALNRRLDITDDEPVAVMVDDQDNERSDSKTGFEKSLASKYSVHQSSVSKQSSHSEDQKVDPQFDQEKNQSIHDTKDVVAAQSSPFATDQPIIEPDDIKQSSDEKLQDSAQEVETIRSASLQPQQKLIFKKQLSDQTTFREEVPELTIDTDQGVIGLDDELWALQPNTRLAIELNKFVILEANNIQRILVLEPGFIEVEQLDNNRLKVSALRRGTTFLHLWDDRGRWTFHVEVVYAASHKRSELEEIDPDEIHVDPFRLTYSNSWSSFYQGDSFSNLDRLNLSFTQWAGFYGPTPYGDISGSLRFFKFAESTEIVGKGLALSNGRIGPFRDFTIRAYDTAVRFSPLSVPGRYFRGGLLDAYAFNRNLRYVVFHGKDRATFTVTSPGTVDLQESFLQGGRFTLFPDKDHQFSFNYARGYGDARPNDLKEKVYSAETLHKIGDLEIRGEVATDEDETASYVDTRYRQENYKAQLNLRDINPGFSTIVGRPSNAGEAGGILRYDYFTDDIRLYSDLDIYRDRENFNEEREDELNYDLSSSFYLPISDETDWRTSFYYTYTPQLLSPRRSLRVSNRLTRKFQYRPKHYLTTFIGGGYQRNRYEFSPGADFNRYNAIAGMRIGLIKNLSYFLNYEQSWVEDIEGDNYNQPSVLNTGFNYVKDITDKLYGRLGLTYRDEQETDSGFSFLAGEDSVVANLGLTYRPKDDLELFFDSRLGSIWAEENDRDSYNDAEVRMGVRSTWDTFFKWDPVAEINGTVFKDVDGNSLFTSKDIGIANVIVLVGDKQIRTNEQGFYRTRVRAKQVNVRLDIPSLPKGFVFATPIERRVDILHKSEETINFGLTIRSSIYGVVFHDANQNGKNDPGEKRMSRVKIKLDGDQETQTDYDGVYVFDNIQPGDHTIVLDVNSLPLEYLPLIKIKNMINVEEGTTYLFNVPLKKK